MATPWALKSRPELGSGAVRVRCGLGDPGPLDHDDRRDGERARDHRRIQCGQRRQLRKRESLRDRPEVGDGGYPRHPLTMTMTVGTRSATSDATDEQPGPGQDGEQQDRAEPGGQRRQVYSGSGG